MDVPENFCPGLTLYSFLDPIQVSSFAFVANLLPKRREEDMQHLLSVFLVSCTQQQ